MVDLQGFFSVCSILDVDTVLLCPYLLGSEEGTGNKDLVSI